MFKQLLLPILFLLISHDSQAASKNGPAVILIEDFTSEYVDSMISKMEELKKDKRELWIKISSDGGSVGAGLKLAQAMENYGSPVVCVVDVNAFSMGFFFLQFCDVRLATARSLLMAHKPSVEVRGNPEELRVMADTLDALTDSMVAVCVSRMNITEKFFKSKINKGDWFFSATEALKMDAIDGIIEPRDIPKDLVKVEVPLF